jgi:FkbM family methyltransferase
MKILSENPDWFVFDIGAQIGQYSLFAAKLGHNVIAVEPFYNSLIRIHKAARLERLESRIRLFPNAISDKRGEIKLLHKNEHNIGGQALRKYEYGSYTKSDLASNKYLVETILLDDLLEYLPIKGDREQEVNAIMKLDIEGFEWQALSQAYKLFRLVDIRVVFMEWLHMDTKDVQDVRNMLRFLARLITRQL